MCFLLIFYATVNILLNFIIYHRLYIEIQLIFVYLIFYLVTLLNSPINSSNFLIDSL